MTAVYIIIALLLTLSAFCLRMSHWHNREAAYWSRVAVRVQIDPAQEPTYRPVLEWRMANPSSVWTRLQPWRSPEERMRRDAS